MKKLNQWLNIYGIKNVFARGLYTKLPIIPVAKDELLRRMNWQLRARKRLKPYLHIRQDNQELQLLNKFPKTIWWMWFQGVDKAPNIVKKCLESVEYFASQMDYKVIILDENNIDQYISLPRTILDKWKCGKIGNANFSDLCRVSLLAQYGGIWIDSTVLLTGLIDETILNAELFFFKASFLDMSATKISSWFMSANKAGNAFLLSVRDSLFSYFEQNRYIDDYFIFHLCVAELSERKEFKDKFESIPFYSNTYPQLMCMELTKKYDVETINHILNKSNIHKLTYKGLDGLDSDTFYYYLINKRSEA
jgi:hypothetical protein